jgi:hypothetical protein
MTKQTPMSGSNPTGKRNEFEHGTTSGWSPPAGKFSPPAAGAHGPKSVHKIPGGHGAGSTPTHYSLRVKDQLETGRRQS